MQAVEALNSQFAPLATRPDRPNTDKGRKDDIMKLLAAIDKKLD